MTSRISDALLRVIVYYKDDEGQALAEYALILGLIAIVAVTALTVLGIALSGQLDEVSAGFGGGGS